MRGTLTYWRRKVKRQPPRLGGKPRRSGDDGWAWMLRWLFGSVTRPPSRKPDDGRIYLAPF